MVKISFRYRLGLCMELHLTNENVFTSETSWGIFLGEHGKAGSSKEISETCVLMKGFSGYSPTKLRPRQPG